MTTQLTIKVVPSSSQNAVSGWLESALKVRVTQPPENGKANKAVIATLATALEIPRQHITLCKGHTASTKVVEVDGLSAIEIRQKIQQIKV